jgi:hypothetical protein|eukprot:COSAG01_NODE_864_length_13055_cov_18.442498_12_plen_59_part_00
MHGVYSVWEEVVCEPLCCGALISLPCPVMSCMPCHMILSAGASACGGRRWLAGVSQNG